MVASEEAYSFRNRHETAVWWSPVTFIFQNVNNRLCILFTQKKKELFIVYFWSCSAAVDRDDRARWRKFAKPDQIDLVIFVCLVKDDNMNPWSLERAPSHPNYCAFPFYIVLLSKINNSVVKSSKLAVKYIVHWSSKCVWTQQICTHVSHSCGNGFCSQ